MNLRGLWTLIEARKSSILSPCTHNDIRPFGAIPLSINIHNLFAGRLVVLHLIKHRLLELLPMNLVSESNIGQTSNTLQSHGISHMLASVRRIQILLSNRIICHIKSVERLRNYQSWLVILSRMSCVYVFGVNILICLQLALFVINNNDLIFLAAMRR